MVARLGSGRLGLHVSGLSVCTEALFRGFCDVFHTVGKLGDGFSQVCRKPSIVYCFVDLEFRLCDKEAKDILVVHDTLSFLLNKWFQLERTTCH